MSAVKKQSLLKRATGWLLLNNPDWSEEERRETVLLRKLDLFFCSYLALSAIVKYLDQTNISNAYVSGMKEDLSLTGNQYNLFTTYFNIGYLLCIPLSNYIINSVIRPSLWLPTLEIIWGIGTGALAASRNATDIYGLRFLIGFAEGTAWPGTMVLLLSWYSPSEVGKRLAVYQSATSLGGVFSGALQAALYNNLNGHGGLAGWRWLFVVNACITVVVGFYGYWGCPDYPDRPNRWAFWFNDSDREIAQLRMQRHNRKQPQGFSWAIIKETLTRPQHWLLWVGYLCFSQANMGYSYFNLWLKSLKNADGSAVYSVSQLNTIPIACNFTTIASLIIFLSLSDRFETQWPFLLIINAIGLIFSAILVKWAVPRGLIFASFIILNLLGCSSNLYVAWIGRMMTHSAEARSILIGAVVVSHYALSAGVPLKVWPASQAPKYNIGWKFALALYIAVGPVVGLTVFFERLQQRKDAKREELGLEEEVQQVNDLDKSGQSSLSEVEPVKLDVGANGKV